MSAQILIVDDEADIRNLIKGILEDEGYKTITCGTSDKAYELIESEDPALIILDIWLQGSADDGLNILKKTYASKPYIPVLMISGHGNIETAVSAIKDGAYDFIEKPFKADRLLLMIRRALEASALKRENIRLKSIHESSDVSKLTGTSSAIERICQTITRVAPTNSRVLLTGEPGTGKNIVARMLHENSERKDCPYLVVNCATLEPEKLEAELFGGYEGAVAKPGLFEKANGGTLVLDEILDMSLPTQARIVRVLLEKRLQKGADGEAVDLDVRILATSNKNLPEAIGRGEFREDLYYRLNVVPLQLPPLRERINDLNVLIEEFTAAIAPGLGIDGRIEFDVCALQKMKSYAWPGNLRQLKNLIEWILIMNGLNGGKPISVEQLPADILGSFSSEKQVSDMGGKFMTMPLREAREAFEREYLLMQIERFDGNISKTAQFVGMERSALHRKLKSLKVNEALQDSHSEEDLRKRA
ncbi:MAG: sigma-54 dependent transcriptional regulator [Micavibrio sp.]|nr:sigma-54 dependent transcriptional regulator [Micavibrio sp.]